MAKDKREVSADLDYLISLPGSTLELAISEFVAIHNNAVDANDQLRAETQQVQSIAAIVVSIVMALAMPSEGASLVFSSAAIVLLILAIIGSFFFLFNRSPSPATAFEKFLKEQSSSLTPEAILRYQIASKIEKSMMSAALLRKRTMFVNLIKAALACSIVFLGCGFLMSILNI